MKTILSALAMVLSVCASDLERGNFGAGISGSSKAITTAKGKRSSYPFSGEVQSHDGKSVTLKGKKKSRVLLLTSETRVLKDGTGAKLKDGEYVSGSARKNGEGREEAVTINLKGPKLAK